MVRAPGNGNKTSCRTSKRGVAMVESIEWQAIAAFPPAASLIHLSMTTALGIS
jgi:hypothetical protein